MARYGMVIDTRKCVGCMDCVVACKTENNVPEGYNRDWIVYETTGASPSLHMEIRSERCNHCDDPPCVRVCPTQATWRREDGVVMMDWHRCIGCRYCVAGCPYGSRSFNWVDPRPHIARLTPDFPTRSKGVVEKCTLCPERLVEGRPPACVEECKPKAMVFGDLEDPGSEVRNLLRTRYAIRRRPELGTRPQVYYLV